MSGITQLDGQISGFPPGTQVLAWGTTPSTSHSTAFQPWLKPSRHSSSITGKMHTPPEQSQLLSSQPAMEKLMQSPSLLTPSIPHTAVHCVSLGPLWCWLWQLRTICNLLRTGPRHCILLTLIIPTLNVCTSPLLHASQLHHHSCRHNSHWSSLLSPWTMEVLLPLLCCLALTSQTWLAHRLGLDTGLYFTVTLHLYTPTTPVVYVHAMVTQSLHKHSAASPPDVLPWWSV
jgi:hypothetical protein